MKHRKLIGLCLSIMAMAMARVFGAELPSHSDWESAQKQAQQSGKYILAYVFQPGQEACVAMDTITFVHEGVIKALQDFEFLAINGDAARHRAFCERFRVGTRWDPDSDRREGRTRFGAVPAFLFLDAAGQEYFRTYGYYAPDVFIHMLGQARQIIQLQRALQERPQDARLQADLGHLYLELERPLQAKPLLEAAIKLDPQNSTGARADAELDLIILSIPDDPDLAIRQLLAYQFNYPQSPRGLEIRYFLAVAQLAAGREKKAEQILLDFAAIPPFLDNAEGLPNVQYGYLVECGERQIGFFPIDDVELVKQKVRELKEDPRQCRFLRKAINPDYRNPWTEKADLLLRQLRELQAKQQNKPTR